MRTLDSEYVTVREVAALIGCSVWVLRDRIRRGEIAAYDRALFRRPQLVRRGDIERLGEVTEVTGTR